MATAFIFFFLLAPTLPLAQNQEGLQQELASYNFWPADQMTTTTAPKAGPSGDQHPDEDHWTSKVLRMLPVLLLELAKPKVKEWLDSEDGGEELVISLKQMVLVGDKLVSFLQEKIARRERPSTSEVLHYGVEQLRIVSGSSSAVEELSSEDSSATLQHGLSTLRHLREVLERGAQVPSEEREGHGLYYGHGGGGYHHHHVATSDSHHQGYGLLDPFVLLATLSFGVFLFQLIYHFLNRSARSLDVVDLHLPLALSDAPEAMRFLLPGQGMQQSFSEESEDQRQPRSLDALGLVEDDFNPAGSFLATLLANLEGYFHIYQQVESNPSCARRYLCRMAVDDVTDAGGGDLVQLFLLASGHFSGDVGVGNFTDDIQTRHLNGEKLGCDLLVPHCTSVS